MMVLGMILAMIVADALSMAQELIWRTSLNSRSSFNLREFKQ